MHSRRVLLCTNDGIITVSKETFRAFLNVFMTYNIADLQLELAANDTRRLWYYDLNGLKLYFGDRIQESVVTRIDKWRIVEGSGLHNGFMAQQLYPDYYILWTDGTFDQMLRDVTFVTCHPIEMDSKIRLAGVQTGEVLLSQFYSEFDIAKYRDTIYTHDRTKLYKDSVRQLLT